MKIIKPSVELIDAPEYADVLALIDAAGRTCYKSALSETDKQREEFVRRAIKRGHESIIEHAKATARIICDRGVSHEIVRHRIASYTQESTRYCNYAKERFGEELTFIKPCFFQSRTPEEVHAEQIWRKAMCNAETAYFAMLGSGAKPEEARSVLPNSIKTEIVVTMNFREWRHFLKLRTDAAAHPQMREVAGMLLDVFKAKYAVFVEDI